MGKTLKEQTPWAADRCRTQQNPSLAELTKRGRGMIDSRVADLASNPKHLVGFGRDDRSHR
jgi:hypothetical protein